MFSAALLLFITTPLPEVILMTIKSAKQGLGSPFNHFDLVQTHLHQRVTYHVDSELVMGTYYIARM